MFELTETKRECERIRKWELFKEKKTVSSFEGFEDICSVSTTDKTPGESIPPVSMFCDTTMKLLSELWTYCGFTCQIVTEA